MTSLQERITETLAACRIERGKQDASGYLPDVIRALDAMAGVVKKGGESFEQGRRRTASLYRVVSDDVDLLRSPLGRKLVGVMNEYRAWTKAETQQREIVRSMLTTARFHGSETVTGMGFLTTGPPKKTPHRVTARRKAAAKPARHAR